MESYPRCICQIRQLARIQSRHRTGEKSLRYRYLFWPSPTPYHQMWFLNMLPTSTQFAFSWISFSYAVRKEWNHKSDRHDERRVTRSKLQMPKYLCHVCNNVVVDLLLPNLLEIIHPPSFGHAEPKVPVIVKWRQKPQNEQNDSSRLTVHSIWEWPTQTVW